MGEHKIIKKMGISAPLSPEMLRAAAAAALAAVGLA
jgi:hypothetical protein